jgi:hypothetical protein
MEVGALVVIEVFRLEPYRLRRLLVAKKSHELPSWIESNRIQADMSDFDTCIVLVSLKIPIVSEMPERAPGKQ